MILDSAIKIIKSKGYKLTKPREAILKTLISSDKMLSCENIYSYSKEIYIYINLTTIYRNLEILESIGVVHKIVSPDGISLYKLICSDNHHHHLICNFCGKVESIDFCPIQKFKEISLKKNFKLVNHKLELYGFCENCTKNIKDK